ncbi:MAG: hypothetical protein Q9215_003778 [Flavoplaca cf. flavocitrina]
MSPLLVSGSRLNISLLIFLATSVLIFSSPAVLPLGKHVDHSYTASRLSRNAPVHRADLKSSLPPLKQLRRVPVPFGVDEYSHNLSTNGHGSPIIKRDLDFELLVCTGGQLLEMIMNAPANNPWVQEDLQNGWTKREDVVAEPPQELDFVLDSMGISRSYIDVKPAYWNQDKTFVDADGNPDTPATLGYYHNKMIPSSGTIIAEANYSPKFKAPNQPLPPLNRWSDIVWLSWVAEAGADASNLILILRNNIITQSTRDLLEFIHSARPDDLQLPWPGIAYDPRSTKEGKAILATSHGQGVAYLLKDHSDVLGRRVPVARIFTVAGGAADGSEGALDDDFDGDSDDGDDFDDEDFLYYYILWELRDAGSPPLKEML